MNKVKNMNKPEMTTAEELAFQRGKEAGYPEGMDVGIFLGILITTLLTLLFIIIK
tara:strand:- start:1270 stop:1434 length:165 start_codon:yes stop_codon:yes gene_type:complete